MTNEEFQKLVLEKLESLDSGMTNMDSRTTTIESKIVNIESKMTNMDSRMTNMENNMATKQELADGIHCLETKIDDLTLLIQKDVKGMLELNNKKLNKISEDIKSLVEVTGDHEIRIRTCPADRCKDTRRRFCCISKRCTG
ncbi:MAG: hypothetical protein ABFD91_00010 [Anaerohalosphaeraceae bacterium]